MKDSDIELLNAEGLITDKQRDEILAQMTNKKAPTIPVPQRALVQGLSAVAGILIVVGALVQAVAHWLSITPLMKSSLGMLVMALAWVGYFLLRKTRPLVAEGLGLVGAGMWGANIVLNQALFELYTPHVEPFALFFIGVLPIPFLVRQRVLIGLVELSSFILLALMLSPDGSWLCMPGLGAGTEWALFMALLLVWWMLGERCRGCYGTCKGYYWVSYPACIAFLGCVQYYLLYNVTEMPTAAHSWCIFAVAAVFALLLKPKDMRRRHWLAASLSSIALLPLALCISGNAPYHEVWGMFIVAAYSGLFMVLCVRTKRMLWGFISMAMAVFIFYDLLVRIHRSLSDSGLFLMATGLAVLVFAFVLEKQRRFLIRTAKTATADPSTSLPTIPKA